jgi:membrane fusion protein, multidrug efflux system
MLKTASDPRHRGRMRAWLAAGVLIAPAILAAPLWYVFHSRRAATDLPSRPGGGRRDVPVELKGIGIVQAFNTVTVKPRIVGQIMQVVFTEGQTVRQGEVLARIDSRFLIAQLHQARATRAKDEAQLGQCEEGFGPSDRRIRQGLCLPPARGRATGAGRHVGAAVQADQAVLENTQVQLDYATVTAPIDGITGIRMVDVGNVISPSDPGIVVITQVKPIAVIFTLPADALAAVAVGQAAGSIPVEVFDRDHKTRLVAGRLALVDNQIDRTTNTVRLKAAGRIGLFVVIARQEQQHASGENADGQQNGDQKFLRSHI